MDGDGWEGVLTIVTWTCCGGISVVLTGVETKLKLRGKKP